MPDARPDGEGDDPRLGRALAHFEAMAREDPRAIVHEGVRTPWSLHYHRRLTHWVLQLDPDASPALRLAAACQHARRWTVPRSRYPTGRSGYRSWRREVAALHARTARSVLEEVGWDEETIGRVVTLVLKRGLGRDPEVQLFEDAICAVFVENELVELATRQGEDKMLDILGRTWAKISEAGRRAALEAAGGLPERERRLLEAATKVPRPAAPARAPIAEPT